MAGTEIWDPGTIEASEFVRQFETAENGTAFHIMGGTTPGKGEQSTIKVSSYNYAHGVDLFPVFGEAHMLHGEYSFEFPRTEIVISASKTAQFAKDNEHLEFLAMRVSVLGEQPIPASLVALGGWAVNNDYWLVRDCWTKATQEPAQPITTPHKKRLFSRR